MRRLVPALLLCAACFHTHSVGKGSDEKPDDDSKPAAKTVPAAGEPAAKPSQVRTPREPGGPPLAAGPGGLFVPGGVGKVQDALAGKGYLDESKCKRGEIDAETSAAVRRFQEAEGIARTGNPDHETLRRLGLDPDQLMRKAENASK